MAIMLLTGILFLSPQKAEAASEPVLNVNNKWSTTYTTRGVTYYKFTVPSDGLLSWQVYHDKNSASNNLYFRILDHNFESLSSGYAPSGQASNKSNVLSAGTYYIRINDYDTYATYKIRLSHTSYGVNDQNARSYASPQTLNINQKIIGVITPSDREDWFKINIPRSGAYVHTVISEGDLVTTLFSNNLAETLNTALTNGHIDLPKVHSLTYQLEAGTYYIRISPGGAPSTGKYVFTLTGAPCKHSYSSKVIKPTYFSKGYTTKTCRKCGNTVKTSYVSQLKISKEKITGISAGSKKLTVKWKKLRGVTGYQIRYSTNKKFSKNVRTKTIAKKTAAKKTISGLKPRKTYYVQVRAYAKKNGKTVYGKWSSKKYIKTKK